jgi:hypothetical protein
MATFKRRSHTWLGLVGPGVREKGRTGEIFSDHTDIRPTIMSLARLKDDYAHDGRVLFEVLTREALPDSLRDNQDLLSRLAAAYKQINAPVGKLGLKTLTGISTQALKGDQAAERDRPEDDHDPGERILPWPRNPRGRGRALNRTSRGSAGVD